LSSTKQDVAEVERQLDLLEQELQAVSPPIK
jgi:hypothetical protein